YWFVEVGIAKTDRAQHRAVGRARHALRDLAAGTRAVQVLRPGHLLTLPTGIGQDRRGPTARIPTNPRHETWQCSAPRCRQWLRRNARVAKGYAASHWHGP